MRPKLMLGGGARNLNDGRDSLNMDSHLGSREESKVVMMGKRIHSPLAMVVAWFCGPRVVLVISISIRFSILSGKLALRLELKQGVRSHEERAIPNESRRDTLYILGVIYHLSFTLPINGHLRRPKFARSLSFYLALPTLFELNILNEEPQHK